MFGQKKSADSELSLLEREGRIIAHLNKEGYAWLGERYQWYHKIRTAKKDGLKLFQDASLEEQMEATRAALSLVTRTLNTALVLAYNSVIDAVSNAGAAPEDWPAMVSADRSDPPPLSAGQDAVIIGWMPLKFLNLAKPVRDKGKGLDFYVDGLVKKLYFKVLGYYADPGNWDPQRLGYFLGSLAPDAGLQEVQAKLGVLKSEAEILEVSLPMFKFGRAARRKEAGQGNAIEDTLEFTDQDLLNDLYFQSFLFNGLEQFIFRYYLTLLSATGNVRALRQISQIFYPLLAKTVELRIRFQTSFATEREKLRLRKPYLEFYKARESLPPVEIIAENGRQTRKINYTHTLLDMNAFSRGETYRPRQKEHWSGYLQREVLDQMNTPRGYALLMELLNTLIWDTQCAMEGKVKAAGTLRAFADEQERLGKIQMAKQKKMLDETKRKKAKSLAKFRAQEQANMVEVVQRELQELEAQGSEKLEQMQQAIEKRREAQIARVDQLEATARQDREGNLGKNAAALYGVLQELDSAKALRSGLVAYIIQQVQEDKDDHSDALYRNLFTVLTDLHPTEKMMLRSAVAQKLTLEAHELPVSEQELEQYRQQIISRKTELNLEVPGVLDQRLAQGPVQAKIDDLLSMGLTPASLLLLFSLPFSGPNKPAAKLPGEAVKKLLMLNQLSNPLAENDITLPNVEASAPAMKRVNFNRLQKLMA
ncbi:MAG: hypothetical protein IIA40_00375 [SAR324 cluster bacterium]|nr:hypothetical protein [SAR324 cluster bacterium]